MINKRKWTIQYLIFTFRITWKYHKFQISHMNTDFQIPTEFRCSPTFENLTSRVRQFEWLHEKRAQEKHRDKVTLPKSSISCKNSQQRPETWYFTSWSPGKGLKMEYIESLKPQESIALFLKNNEVNTENMVTFRDMAVKWKR